MALYAQTLGGMKSRIASEINRSDLSTQVENAINDAILIYQKQRFRFNESVPGSPITFTTVDGQANYTTADNANIGTMYDIDSLIIQIGNTLRTMERENPTTLTVYNQVNTMKGQSLWYAVQGNQIILAPIPAAAYPVTMFLFKKVAAPASDDEADNPWMTDAERLVRARAKYEIATHVTRNAAMAQAMSPAPPDQNGGVVGAAYREWTALKGEANRLYSLKRIRPMKF